MRRVTATLALLVLAATAACTGGGGDDEDKASLPLPKKPPALAGPATGPALVPKVLLAASDDLDTSLGSVDTAQVERRSGAFISGKRVVGYSVDNISGYDLASGKQQWTSKLDLKGGTVCYVSQPDSAIKTFTVAYGDGGFCDKIATLKTSDGSVVEDFDTIDLGLDSGGPVTDMFTVKNVDYVVDLRGGVSRMKDGKPEKITDLTSDRYYQLQISPQAPLLLGSTNGSKGCSVDAYDLPSFDVAWSTPHSELFPDVKEDCVISLVQGNGLWAIEETGERYYLAQMDPKDGSVIGRTDVPKDGDKVADGEFDAGYGALQADHTLGFSDGSVAFPQIGGSIIRYDLSKKKVIWSLDLDQLELRSDDEYANLVAAPLAVTADGRYVMTVLSNATSVELLAVDAKTGKLAARWPLPEEYRNGLQVEPNLELFDDGVVMTRNFEKWEYEFDRASSDRKPPSGDLFDIGVFTFPQPDDKPQTSVPTEGPTDLMLKQVADVPATLPAPGAESKENVNVTLIGNGAKQAVLVDGGDVTAYDEQGKKSWTADLGEVQSVCSTSEPVKRMKTLVVAYRPPGPKDGGCPKIARISASSGKVLDTLDLPSGSKGAFSILTVAGRDYVTTGSRAVYEVDGDTLTKHATLAHQPYYFGRTKEDPELLVTSTLVKPGQWAIDGYDLPSFKKRWSTGGRTLFGTVDQYQYLSPWNGNALMFSANYGSSATSSATSAAAVRLDPETGKVAQKTGKVKYDLLSKDPKKFFLAQASNTFDTVGFDDGSVIVQQQDAVMRYSLKDKSVAWSTNIGSITQSMEAKNRGATADVQTRLIDGNKAVLITLSNDTSTELMTMNAETGKITGRWKVPTATANGLQAGPQLAFLDGGVALAHDDSAWVYTADGAGAKAGKGVALGIYRFPKK